MSIAGDSPMYSMIRRDGIPESCPFHGPHTYSYAKGSNILSSYKFSSIFKLFWCKFLWIPCFPYNLDNYFNILTSLHHIICFISPQDVNAKLFNAYQRFFFNCWCILDLVLFNVYLYYKSWWMIFQENLILSINNSLIFNE